MVVGKQVQHSHCSGYPEHVSVEIARRVYRGELDSVAWTFVDLQNLCFFGKLSVVLSCPADGVGLGLQPEVEVLDGI